MGRDVCSQFASSPERLTINGANTVVVMTLAPMAAVTIATPAVSSAHVIFPKPQTKAGNTHSLTGLAKAQ
jgi:hypothetical protein